MARILIAEDETRIASFIAKGLSANGFTATVVVDGPSALDHAMTGDFDLVVLDIGLPGFDGFEVLRRLRAAGNPIAVVVLTARDSVAEMAPVEEVAVEKWRSKRACRPPLSWNPKSSPP